MIVIFKLTDEQATIAKEIVAFYGKENNRLHALEQNCDKPLDHPYFEDPEGDCYELEYRGNMMPRVNNEKSSYSDIESPTLEYNRDDNTVTFSGWRYDLVGCYMMHTLAKLCGASVKVPVTPEMERHGDFEVYQRFNLDKIVENLEVLSYYSRDDYMQWYQTEETYRRTLSPVALAKYLVSGGIFDARDKDEDGSNLYRRVMREVVEVYGCGRAWEVVNDMPSKLREARLALWRELYAMAKDYIEKITSTENLRILKKPAAGYWKKDRFFVTLDEEYHEVDSVYPFHHVNGKAFDTHEEAEAFMKSGLTPFSKEDKAQVRSIVINYLDNWVISEESYYLDPSVYLFKAAQECYWSKLRTEGIDDGTVYDYSKSRFIEPKYNPYYPV